MTLQPRDTVGMKNTSRDWVGIGRTCTLLECTVEGTLFVWIVKPKLVNGHIINKIRVFFP